MAPNVYFQLVFDFFKPQSYLFDARIPSHNKMLNSKWKCLHEKSVNSRRVPLGVPSPSFPATSAHKSQYVPRQDAPQDFCRIFAAFSLQKFAPGFFAGYLLYFTPEICSYTIDLHLQAVSQNIPKLICKQAMKKYMKK